MRYPRERECLFTLSALPRAVATRQTNFEFINNWCHKFQTPSPSSPHTHLALHPSWLTCRDPVTCFCFTNSPPPLLLLTSKKKNKTVARKSIRNSTCQVHDEAANKQRAAPQQPQPQSLPLPQVLSLCLLHTLNIPHFVMCVCKRVPPLLDSPTIKGSDASGQMSPKRFLNSLPTRASAEVNGQRERGGGGMATPGQLPRVVAPRALNLHTATRLCIPAARNPKVDPAK